MDAQLKKIAITPAKFNGDGEITAEECATLTLNVPLDSTSQRTSIVELMALLDTEWVIAEIQIRQQRSRQQRMDLSGENSPTSE